MDYKELQKLVLELSEKERESSANARYWEDIATKQNDCILMQSDRYDALEKEYLKLSEASISSSTPNNSTNIDQITELKSKVIRMEERNSELDKSLESYEDFYKKLKKENDTNKLLLKKNTNELEDLRKKFVKERKISSILIKECKELELYKTAYKHRNIQQKNPMREEDKKFLQTILKSVKVTLDNQGLYKPNNI